MKEIVTMTTIVLCEMSSLSSKFFGVCGKFPDVSLFRPNLFIEDNSRMRRCHSAVKPAKESSSWKCFIELLVIFLQPATKAVLQSGPCASCFPCQHPQRNMNTFPDCYYSKLPHSLLPLSLCPIQMMGAASTLMTSSD